MASIIQNLLPSTTLPNALPGSAQYTAPANTRAQFDCVTLTNTSATTRVVTIHLVPAGGSPGAGNIVVQTLAVPANREIVVNAMSLQVLPTGGMLYAFADAAGAINLRASGREISV